MSVAVRATVLRLLESVQRGDLRGERIGGFFTADAVYHVQVPAMAKVTGPEAIAGELVRQTAHYSALECEIHRVVAGDGAVVVERTDHLVLPGGARVANELVAVFEGDESGRITAWREYWDSVALGQRMKAAAGTTDEERR